MPIHLPKADFSDGQKFMKIFQVSVLVSVPVRTQSLHRMVLRKKGLFEYLRRVFFYTGIEIYKFKE